ncbi:MAG TPA: DUF1330 domain-containing protein [Solirubrobacteraceae bacterium]|nr:DUF1330 domain-containing protein [Solirubrobacteraceae bacterium]
MPAYVIAFLRAPDLDAPALQDYRAANTPLVARHGGHFIVRGGRIDPLEGSPPGRVVVIEFPDAAAARAWYDDPDYAEIREWRRSASEIDLLIVDGV